MPRNELFFLLDFGHLGLTAEYPATPKHISNRWLRGYAATWLCGYGATYTARKLSYTARKLSYLESVATWLRGYAATELHGYGATRLEAELRARYFFYIMLLFPCGKNHATQELNSFFNQCTEFETIILEPKQERYT